MNIDVGGYSLNVRACGNSSGPTVLLESGSLMPAVLWYPVQSEVSAFARVVSYDRAGYGRSQPASPPRTPERVVQDLQTLLQRTEIPGPYVLVGHSLGGAYIRLFAHRYREQVAGLVLVDAYNEHIRRSYTPAMRRLDRYSRRVLTALSHLGLPQFLFRRNPGMLTGGSRNWLSPFPAELRREVLRQMYSPRLTWAASREWGHIEHLEELLGQQPHLGDVPVIVLSKGRFDRIGGPGLKEADWERMRQADVGGQAMLAGLSSRGQHMTVEGCGHVLPLEAPDAIVSAIRSIVEALHLKTPTPPLPSNK